MSPDYEALRKEGLVALGRSRGVAEEPTRYAVICPEHGQVFLTKEEYDRQMRAADDRWRCPWCTQVSQFDDDNYEKEGL